MTEGRCAAPQCKLWGDFFERGPVVSLMPRQTAILRVAPTRSRTSLRSGIRRANGRENFQCVRSVVRGVAALACLAAGFPSRERILRLEGLGLFALCILKLFIYDLRNLETAYRILSFIALGAFLLGVSLIYTRFRTQIQRYL